MSTNNAFRKRAQKHKNAKGWTVDKFHTDEKTKIVKNLVVTNCCEKCTEVIEWKIKYGKYKPLSQPGKCTRCHEKRIKSAYHTICTPCVRVFQVCAKCNQKETEIVNEVRPTAIEDAQLQSNLSKELKALPERKRRTFLRYLTKKEEGITGKAKKTVPEEDNEIDNDCDNDPEVDDATKKTASAKSYQLNLVRKEALDKLKDLTEKFGNKDDFDFEDLDLSDVEDSDDE